MAFEVVGPQQTEEAYEHLHMRECNLGGYQTSVTNFFPHNDSSSQTLPVVVYIATGDNPYYMGNSSIESMALDIASAEGQCGHNVEYLMKLTSFFHEQGLYDSHLYELERAVLEILREREIPLASLMNHSCHHLDNVPELEHPESPVNKRKNFAKIWSAGLKNSRNSFSQDCRLDDENEEEGELQSNQLIVNTLPDGVKVVV